MPTYDYLCPNGHRFEVLQSVTADAPDTCPICGASPVRKAFSAPTIHFKGSGWAKKDRSSAARSASKAASAAAESGSGSGSDAGGGAASGTDKESGSSGDPPTPAKPAVGKTSSGETGKGSGSSTPAGPAAAD
jgi:putative FmdB family regulatory protein